MAGLKIKKGDRVQVLTGKDRGKKGEVMRAMPAERQGHRRRRQRRQEAPAATRATMQGGIIDKDMPIPVANVAIVCPACGKRDPRRLQDRRRRHQGPRLQEVRR